MNALKPLLAKVSDGRSLSHEEAVAAFQILMSGEATPSQIGAFLMALRVRGETVEELSGAVTVMREKMLRVEAPADAIDIVGTGGDSSGSFNISTCAAIVAAGAGLKVAKHGNRALSSRSGSADVLVALGVKLDTSPEKISECIREAGVGFMFAPQHHTSMKHVGPTRVELGTRTIFNLLGPLSNPAGVKRQITGVYSKAWVEPFAQVLKSLGSEACWICHGKGGVDEIISTGTTWIAELKDGEVREFNFTPESVGIARSNPEDLKGGDASENAGALKTVLSGQPSAFADAAVMTAGAAIVVAGKAKNLKSAIMIARDAVASGKAAKVLKQLVEVSNS
jgi:anthranilate phosphoribosyltransferase